MMISDFEAVVNSFSLVFISEMGDKTQLLALVLVARFKRPWTILLGVFIATILNHALATYVGLSVANYLGPEVMRWVLSTLFVFFAFWILIPDKEEDLAAPPRYGALLTTIVAFFLAEMGDKTQLATVALGANYLNLVAVTVGSTLGMMGSNALAIFLGERLLKRIPMNKVRIVACLLFIGFGIGIFFEFI